MALQSRVIIIKPHPSTSTLLTSHNSFWKRTPEFIIVFRVPKLDRTIHNIRTQYVSYTLYYEYLYSKASEYRRHYFKPRRRRRSGNECVAIRAINYVITILTVQIMSYDNSRQKSQQLVEHDDRPDVYPDERRRQFSHDNCCTYDYVNY